MPRTRWLLPLVALSLLACQTELYPEAPILPSTAYTRPPSTEPGSGSATTDPGWPTGTLTAIYDGGVVLTSGKRWVEYFSFLSAANKNAVVWGFMPRDERGEPLIAGTRLTGTLRATLNGTPVTKALKDNPMAETPYVYLIPSLVGLDPSKTYQLHLEITAGSTTYSVDVPSKSS